MMEKVLVLGKPTFNSVMEENKLDDNNVEKNPFVAFISINDTAGQWSESWFNEDHKNVLRLWFDDVETDMELSPTNKISCRTFTEEQANKILDFIEANIDKKTFIVHCTAGISRSGALGSFIADYFALDYNEFKKINPHVYPNGHILRTLNKLIREDSKRWQKRLSQQKS